MAAFKTALALVAVLLAIGAADAHRPHHHHKPAAGSVAEFVIKNKNKGFGILLEAVLAASPAIVETLSKPDLKATVFAPDDHSFRLLLKELKITKKALLANKELLDTVLLYHVIGGAKVLSKDLKRHQVVQTLLDGPDGKLKITKAHRKVHLYTTSGGSALVKGTDIVVGKHGSAVIHAINRVLIPGDKVKF